MNLNPQYLPGSIMMQSLLTQQLKYHTMKTLFSLSMLILIASASFVSYKLFFKSHYDISALLTLTSFVATILTVYVLSSKKIIIS